ncbi:hypothetical protein BA953_08785 [Vibrio coralliilyticus]|uniref:hypothetical protein n=1 Tax=Vibrio coralliilyticus TaxID=190893 RepID=UPI000810BC67|nr:hypothetical protein [Vibrio coralliilyticus]ANW24306.1 hypothetical protein BA953_08785 [Vibrio coralliilyticus]
MHDKVIWLCCVILVSVGALFGINFNTSENFIAQLASAATILGGFATVFAFVWAIKTYSDWKKTQRLNEYNNLIEMGQYASSVCYAVHFLFDTVYWLKRGENAIPSRMASENYNQKVSHAISMYENSLENYINKRACVDFLSHRACDENEYVKLDFLIKDMEAIFWLIREQEQPAIFVTEIVNGEMHLQAGMDIPAQTLESLKIPNPAAKLSAHIFYSTYTKAIEERVKQLLLQVSTST